MSKLNLPEDMKTVVAISPITTNQAVEGDIISLKNCSGRVHVLVSLTQAVAHATAITLYQTTDVANSLSDAKAIVNAVPIWSNLDVASSDTLTARTAAVSYTVPEEAKNMLVCFQVDADRLDTANGFDCLQVRIAASSQATNYASAFYLVENKYAGASAPTVITD